MTQLIQANGANSATLITLVIHLTECAYYYNWKKTYPLSLMSEMN
jgi:hypothetical protein